MAYNNQRGFSVVELIMVILIIVILSIGGAALMIYLIQNSIFIPRQLNMDMIAADALDIMIKGDSGAKGLRFSKSINSIQNNQLTFVNQDGENIIYRLDTNNNKLYRSIDGSPEDLIPYYVTSDVDITAISNSLFTYYASGGGVTSNPADVRHIGVALVASTGSGAYEDWQGRSELQSAIAVKRFQ